jgi:hypothetical protein
MFDRKFLFTGKIIRQEKDRGKEKSRAEGKGREVEKWVLSPVKDLDE